MDRMFGQIKRLELPSLNADARVYLAKVAIIAIAYLILAKLGLTLAFTTEQITPVWPPAGLALAMIFLWGYRFWPGVFLGALLANALTHEPALVALGIAAGNTLEALGAVYMLRWVGFDADLSTSKDYLILIVFAGFISTAISASIGVLSLALGGLVHWANYEYNWLVWWSGDMMGDVIFGSLFLVLASPRTREEARKKPVETSILMSIIFAATMVVFTLPKNNFFPLLLVVYVIFPFMIWAAFRLTQVGVVVSTFIIMSTAVWATLENMGPFTRNGISAEDNLIYLELFIFLIQVTSMTLAITVARRIRIEQELRRRTKELEEANERITKIVTGMLDKEDALYFTQHDERQ